MECCPAVHELPLRHALFGLLIVALSLIVWRSLYALAIAAYGDDRYSHTLLVLPLSLSLIAVELKRTPVIPRYSKITGTMWILLAALVWSACRSKPGLSMNYGLSIDVLVLVICWLGLVIAFYGPQVFKTLLFPLLLLFLMVPLPQQAIGKIVGGLQVASTYATFTLFKVAGVPVLANGFIISLPGFDIEIAKECSGIRSSIVLVLTALIIQHFCLCSGWAKAVFVLAVVPLAIAKNAVRIFTLSMLAIKVDPDFLTGRLHHEGGIVFYLLALASLLIVLRVLQTVDNIRSARRSTGPPLKISEQFVQAMRSTKQLPRKYVSRL
jgi:exosortase